MLLFCSPNLTLRTTKITTRIGAGVVSPAPISVRLRSVCPQAFSNCMGVSNSRRALPAFPRGNNRTTRPTGYIESLLPRYKLDIRTRTCTPPARSGCVFCFYNCAPKTPDFRHAHYRSGLTSVSGKCKRAVAHSRVQARRVERGVFLTCGERNRGPPPAAPATEPVDCSARCAANATPDTRHLVRGRGAGGGAYFFGGPSPLFGSAIASLASPAPASFSLERIRRITVRSSSDERYHIASKMEPAPSPNTVHTMKKTR